MTTPEYKAAKLLRDLIVASEKLLETAGNVRLGWNCPPTECGALENAVRKAKEVIEP